MRVIQPGSAVRAHVVVVIVVGVAAAPVVRSWSLGLADRASSVASPSSSEGWFGCRPQSARLRSRDADDGLGARCLMVFVNGALEAREVDDRVSGG